MHLSTTQKVVLGMFTILPLVLLPYIFFQVFHTLLYNLHDVDPEFMDSTSQKEFFFMMIQIMIPSMIISLLSIGLLIFYLIHVAKNNSLNTNERLIWILIFVFAGIIGFPIYWYMQIWKAPASTNYPR
jgi:TM2 domain-containing membrane protein YozV